MILVILIDLIVVGGLVFITVRKGLEQALPFFTFFMVLVPGESQIPLPGLFDLTTQRLAVMTLMVLYLIPMNKEGGRPKLPTLPLKYLILMHAGWMFVSTMNSVVFTISFKAVLSQIFDFYVVYYIFAKTVSEVRTIHKILFAMVIAMVVCCFLGYVESYHSWSVIDLFPKVTYRFGGGGALAIDEERGFRSHSTFPHAILFGGALAMCIPQTLYLLTLAKTRGQKAFLWAGLMLMFMNIYKTTSRGPWMALMISLALLLLFGASKTRKHLLVIAALILTVLIVRPGVWDTIKNVYFSTLDPESPAGESYEYRYALLRIAREAVSKDFGRRMWGYGPESFYFLGLEGEFQGKIIKFESADSSIAELLTDTGYAGLFILASLLLKAAAITLRNFVNMPKPANSLCLVMFTSMIAFYFLMTNVAIFGWGQQSYMLWVLIAVAMTYAPLTRAVSVPLGMSTHSPIAVGRPLANAAKP